VLDMYFSAVETGDRDSEECTKAKNKRKTKPF